MANRVTWSDDGAAAYLIDEYGNVTGRWFRDRPELSTFDPTTYTYGQGYGYQAPGQQQSYMYDAWRGGGGYGGGDDGGFLQDQDRQDWEELRRRFELTYEESVRLREENARQHDERMEQLRLDSERLIMIERERIAATTGDIRLRHQNRLVELEREHQYAVQYLQLDWTERHKAADRELAMRLREIQGQERMAAAETWWRPIDYGAYAKWAAGEPAATTASGLPVGAPEWQTGEPAQAIGAGGVPTSDPYGVKLAAGGRIQEFGAWGGPTTPVMGTPWVPPHKASLTQFVNMPRDMQQMAYGRWRHRGISPEQAQQTMYAAAPVGTAPAQVRYG